MPLQHPQGRISEWPQHFHDILHNGSCILSCDEWPVIAVSWVFKHLGCEFRSSEGSFEQLHGRVPTCLHIHNRKYRDAGFGRLTVNDVVSKTRC